MADLMNKNDYQNGTARNSTSLPTHAHPATPTADPLSQGNPCNQISARCDLAGDAFGGIDSKNVDLYHVYSQAVLAIGAPSHVYEPVYEWTPEFAGVSHIGMPTVFNFNWTTMYPETLHP